jgi:DNA-binding NtrC family response regulator
LEGAMKKPVKILIIDDNEEIINILHIFFTSRHYTVSTAVNGLDGLKLIEADNISFDLIITDLVMPHISGAAIISIVKKKYPAIPIIAITGWGEHPEILAAEAHADAILEKPFDLSKLEQIVKNVLNKKADGHKHNGHKP